MKRHLVFLLEEPSAQDALEGLLPRLLPEGIQTHFLVFEGKQDLEKQMTRRLRGWLLPQSRFIIMRDQDSGDCHRIKAALVEKCRDAGRPDAIVRIAYRELEAFFIGDWAGVATAFSRPQLARLSAKAIYRQPDNLGSPSAELRRHIPEYQKRDGARRIGRHLSITENRSNSLRALVAAVSKACQP